MSEIKPGAKVRHPARGDGVVSTVAYSPLTRRAVKAVVEFGFSPGVTRKYECWAADLVLIEAPVKQPAFQIVEHEQVVA